MPYLRLTADRRGVEHTFLLHVAAPGERPKVLYWYRTVPGVKIGRPALAHARLTALVQAIQRGEKLADPAHLMVP